MIVPQLAHWHIGTLAHSFAPGEQQNLMIFHQKKLFFLKGI